MESVQPSISADALRAYLATAIPGAETEIALEPLDHREHQSYLLNREGQEYVLRLGSLEQVEREWAMVSGMREAGVPVPEPVAICTDTGVIGEPFYLRRHLPGHIVRQRLPKEWPRNAATRQDMSTALVDLLLQLHAVDPKSISGISAAGYLQREMDYWTGVWQSSPYADIKLMQELRQRLLQSLPGHPPTAVVHGDFRLQHVVFDWDNPARVAAVVGWEDSGIGDPLCDIGLLLRTWIEDPEDPLLNLYPELQLVLDDGFYSRATLLHEYSVHTPLDMSQLDWYMAFGTFKLVSKAARIIGAGRMPEAAASPFTNKAFFDAIDRALNRASASNLPGLNGR